MDSTVFIDPSEFQTIVVNFITSGEYKEYLKSIQDTQEAGFITGLCIASMLTTKCTKYIINCQE